MRVITLDSNNNVVGVKTVGENYILEANDIETELGNIGQIMQEDGTFITPIVEPTTPKPTLEERFAELKENQLILMDVLASMYEDMLAKGTV